MMKRYSGNLISRITQFTRVIGDIKLTGNAETDSKAFHDID